MKGVPLRIELGAKELKEGKLTIFRRDNNQKDKLSENKLLDYINKTKEEIDKNLIKQADELFKGNIVDVKNKKDLKEIVNFGKIARCGFCSVEKDG